MTLMSGVIEVMLPPFTLHVFVIESRVTNTRLQDYDMSGWMLRNRLKSHHKQRTKNNQENNANKKGGVLKNDEFHIKSDLFSHI